MLFPEEQTSPHLIWNPSRKAGLKRLQEFSPFMGRSYASKRNYDFGPENRSYVSALSPWISHRLILEEEALKAALSKHSFSSVEKFVQEVFWRGYFKGWLEQHPHVWVDYKSNLKNYIERLDNDESLKSNYEKAVKERTGIECFDFWSNELIEFGYLHNHTRMWFASIWIFMLRLPWELGADFFYRNLLDGDAASNTLSWRWVAGLHTKGKTYLARASNIECYTEGRFNPIDPQDFYAEWKWDGIRVQLVFDNNTKRLFSRTGDDISHTLPDVLESLNGSAVLDGELLVGHDFTPLPFNCLQQRLNRKTVVKKHLDQYPAYICVYDVLFDGDEDVRERPLTSRRQKMETWFSKNENTRLTISDTISFSSWNELSDIRLKGAEIHGHEGIMLKRKESFYEAGRPKGPWFKWKRDPKLVDAILMYGQRGHGKRSSFYSDYTFGVWHEEEIVPIGKAYSGFTDEELKQLDKWVRANTLNRFGPVREVKKEIVLEIAFDSAHHSTRHKSGLALLFPRINRIRWDKPVNEVEPLQAILKALNLDDK
ncbi:MAG: cisplatin damage response ATP-dependent DNA ligase [Pseudomonadota bacterium]